ELGITHWGTGALYDLMHVRRMMPTRNFRETWFEHAPKMNAYFYTKAFAPKKGGCRGCHIQCKRLAMDKHIPEFESMSHFSALIDNDDLQTAMDANHLCNMYGMDTISMGGTLACWLEISGEETTREKILTHIRDTALGQNLGKELGGGSARYAARMGHPELAMAVKGQELPAYDPRGAYGMALAYATSTRGGCHLRAYPISHEILRKPVATDRFSFSSKARIIKLAEDLNGVIDSLTACKFLFLATSLEEFAQVFHGVTGVSMGAHDLMKAGERILYNERMMNCSNGFEARDDDLPPRFFLEEGSTGNSITVLPLDRQEFLDTRSRYYHIRGLDPQGRPMESKAKELMLPWNG
ncbi:aldehyde ferredoxin oxidoreductase C-terminal domain-containing protein, partial [Myxococcota bacterium]|nr:aldehyde ferredoxin oxidoreductase C-terminal domain-containing protein [Myxococcota bacterium]